MTDGKKQCPNGQYSIGGASTCQNCAVVCTGASNTATICDQRFPTSQTQNAFCVSCASCLDLGCPASKEKCYPCSSFYKGDSNVVNISAYAGTR